MVIRIGEKRGREGKKECEGGGFERRERRRRIKNSKQETQKQTTIVLVWFACSVDVREWEKMELDWVGPSGGGERGDVRRSYGLPISLPKLLKWSTQLKARLRLRT